MTLPAVLDVGVCVPVLNERAALGTLFDDIESTFAGGRYTVCVVDDGSTDGTRDLVKERARTDPRIVLLERPGCGMIDFLKQDHPPFIIAGDGETVALMSQIIDPGRT